MAFILKVCIVVFFCAMTNVVCKRIGYENTTSIYHALILTEIIYLGIRKPQ